MFEIKKLVIKIAIAALNLIYFPFKCFKTQNKITYISRQADTPSIDFILLKNQMELLDNNIRQVVLAKKIGKSIFKKLSYGLHIFIQMYHIATSKVVVVDTYIIPVSVLKHKKDLKVIQIWHALGAIKKFGYQVVGKKEGSSELVADAMKMHKNYDVVTCASKVTAKFFSEAFNIDKKQIKILGMPRVDYIKSNNKNVAILESNPHYEGKQTVLYIPTFRKTGSIDILPLIETVDKEKYNLIIRLHPLDSTEVPQENKVQGDFSTYDLMQFADYIITDYSAAAIEASILQKPLFLYVYDIDEYNQNRGLNVKLTDELKESTFKEIKDIIKVIENNSYNFDKLKYFREKYVETYNENNTENICKLIKTFLDN